MSFGSDIGLSGVYAGIDICGNGIKIGTVDDEGALLEADYIPLTEEQRTPEYIADRVAEGIEERSQAFSEGKDLDGVGIGFPGFLDKSGCVVLSPNLPAFNGVNVQKLFQERFPRLTITAAKVSNANAMGEYRFGIGRRLEAENLLVYTLGAGVDAGIIIGGKLFVGDRGFAGDLGHVKVFESSVYLKDQEIQCMCSRSGCVEQICGETAFATMFWQQEVDDPRDLMQKCGLDPLKTSSWGYKALASAMTPETMSQLTRDGNVTALHLWHRYGFYLGKAIGAALHTLAIDSIVIGGRIARFFNLFETGIREGLVHDGFPPARLDAIRIYKGEIDSRHAEIFGAAALAAASQP